MYELSENVDEHGDEAVCLGGVIWFKLNMFFLNMQISFCILLFALCVSLFYFCFSNFDTMAKIGISVVHNLSFLSVEISFYFSRNFSLIL